MLPAAHRLRRAGDFHAVLRGRGSARAGSAVLVVHCLARPDRAGMPVRIGFVVSRAVGNAVTRNRVKRRLRAGLTTRLADLPTGVDIAVRAQPAAAEASFADVDAALERQLWAALRRCRADGSEGTSGSGETSVSAGSRRAAPAGRGRR